uniref:Uncharacterized protein n=1 Tax=Arundo donax TaxID=35708 RepID=A0A0A9AHK5_ARUDO
MNLRIGKNSQASNCFHSKCLMITQPRLLLRKNWRGHISSVLSLLDYVLKIDEEQR